MADIRIKDLATTASTTASDDFMAVDGTTNGTRKLSAATPSFATSVTVPGVAGPTATDLTLAGGSTGASLVLGQGATAGALNLRPTGSGAANIKPATNVTQLLLEQNNATANWGLFADSTDGSLQFKRSAGSAALSINGGTNATTFNANPTVTTGGFTTLSVASTSSVAQASINFLTQSDGVSGWTFGKRDDGLSGIPLGSLSGIYNSTGVFWLTKTGGLVLKDSSASTSSITGALQVAGGIYAGANSVFAGDRLLAQKDQNAVTRLQVRNDTSGTAAQSQVSATLGDFTTYTAMGSLSAGFTTSGLFAANAGYIASNATAGLNLFTVGATSLTLGTNSTAALTLASGGAATFAGAVTAGGNVIISNGNLGVGGAVGSFFDILQGGNDAYVYNRRAGSLILGTNNTTLLTFATTGAATFANSTASTGVGTGALQVAGGIYAGAASVFAGQLTAKGTATNDSAATGYIGEFVSASLAAGSAVTLANNTTANITSVSLTAGDWDVEANAILDLTGATVTTKAVGISATSATLGSFESYSYQRATYTTITGADGAISPTYRISIASTTTVYAVTQVGFSAGTVKIYGSIRARRVR